ncbi:MAG: hypothetical protein SNJ70_05420 [Armatimonadota bacterium]
MNNLSFGNLFRLAIESFKKFTMLSIVGYLIYSAIQGAASNIPVINIIFSIVFVFPLTGGFTLFFIKLTKNIEPSFGELFDGFKEIPRWMGVGWLFILYVAVVFVIAGIPLWIGFGIFSTSPDNPASIFALVFLGLISILIAFIVIARWAFVYYVAADEGLTAKAAIARSEYLTEGFRPQIYFYTIIFMLFGFAGAIALGVGILVTLPIAQLGLTHMYLTIKSIKEPNQY